MGVSSKRHAYPLGNGRENIGLVRKKDDRRIIRDARERSIEIVDAGPASRTNMLAPGESFLIAESREPESLLAFCEPNALVFQHRDAGFLERDLCCDRTASARERRPV